MVKLEYKYRRSLIIVLSIDLIFGCLSASKGCLSGYFDMVLPISFLSFIFMVWVLSIKSDVVSATAIVILMYTGLLTQLLIADEEYLNKLMPIIAVAFVAVILTDFIFRSKLIKKKRLILLLLASNILMYVLLIVSGVSRAGTTAWVTIASITFQATDVIKLLAIYVLALLNYTEMKESHRIVFSTIFSLLNCMTMLLLNEIGTAIIIFIVFVSVTLIYSKRYRNKVIVALAITAVLGIALCVCIYSMDIVDTSSKITSVVAKIQHRFDVWLNYENAVTQYYGYQAQKAKQAALLGGLLGAPDEFTVKIPESDNDFIFSEILMRFGVLAGFMIVILYLLVMVRTMKRTIDSPLAVSSAVAFSAQALIMLFGSTNFFIMTGLPLPLLSTGGTNMVVSFILIYHMMKEGGRRHEVK